jgi:hypothetical protein
MKILLTSIIMVLFFIGVVVLLDAILSESPAYFVALAIMLGSLFFMFIVTSLSYLTDPELRRTKPE